MWDGLSVDGEIYGIPNQQINGSRYGFIVQKRFADKYGLDPSTIKTIADIEPFLEQIKQNEPGIIPIGLFGGSFVNPQAHDDQYWVVPGLTIISTSRPMTRPIRPSLSGGGAGQFPPGQQMV